MVSIKELQEKHIDWELDCPDRFYLNLYCPILNSLGGVVTVIRRFLEFDVPFPFAFKSVRDDFVDMTCAFAEENGLEIHRFDKKDKKSREEIVQEHLEKFPWKEGVFFIGKEQEKVKYPQGSWVKSEVIFPLPGFPKTTLLRVSLKNPIELCRSRIYFLASAKFFEILFPTNLSGRKRMKKFPQKNISSNRIRSVSRSDPNNLPAYGCRHDLAVELSQYDSPVFGDEKLQMGFNLM